MKTRLGFEVTHEVLWIAADGEILAHCALWAPDEERAQQEADRIPFFGVGRWTQKRVYRLTEDVPF